MSVVQSVSIGSVFRFTALRKDPFASRLQFVSKGFKCRNGYGWGDAFDSHIRCRVLRIQMVIPHELWACMIHCLGAPAAAGQESHSVQEARLALREPHAAPPTDFVKAEGAGQQRVLLFLTANGGVEATILFLLERPGPMTVPKGRGVRVGSGFINRDNDDPRPRHR